MSDLPSVKQKIQVESTRYRSAVSEFFAQTLGKSINFLIDKYDGIYNSLLSKTATKITQISMETNQVGQLLTYTCPANKKAFIVVSAFETSLVNTNKIVLHVYFPGEPQYFEFDSSGGGNAPLSIPFSLLAGNSVSARINFSEVSSNFKLRIVGIEFEDIDFSVP